VRTPGHGGDLGHGQGTVMDKRDMGERSLMRGRMKGMGIWLGGATVVEMSMEEDVAAMADAAKLAGEGG